jgi:DNA polymerase-3 subunit alpha
MYITQHPVAQALADLPEDPNRLTLSMLSEAHIGQKIEIIGMLTGLRKLITKKGDTMLTAQVEDLEGSIEMVAFPKVYEKYGDFWIEDNVVAISGKIETRRDALQLVCDSVAPYTEATGSSTTSVQAASGMAGAINDFGHFAVADFDNFGGYDDPDMDAPPPDDPAWSLLSSSPLPVAIQGASSHNGHTNGTANGNINGSANGHTNVHSRTQDLTLPSDDGHASSSAPLAGEQHVEDQVGVLPVGQQPASQAPAAMPAATPVTTVMRPRQRIQIARKEAEARTDAPAPSGPQYHLHVTLNRSDDFDADVRAMQEIDRTLRRFVGEHKISLYIPRDDCLVVLEPFQRVNPAQELITTLQALLGEDHVQLEAAQ